MAFDLQIKTEQRQGAALTPALRQAIGLLRMSAEELLAYVYEQSLGNPFLEMEWPDRPVSLSPAGRSLLSDRNGAECGLRELPECASREETLEQSLVRQLDWEVCSPEARAAAAYLAGNLDDSGYLDFPLEDLARASGFGPALLNEGLRVLQRLEPAGVGARDGRECLLLQAQRDETAPPLTEELIAFHLDELARGRMDRIRKAAGPGAADRLDRAAAYIRGLNPRPYVPRGRMPESVVIPEARIEYRCRLRRTEWNAGAQPGVKLGDDYAAAIHDRDDDALGVYVNGRLAEARWLVKGLAYRRRTVRSVIGAVAEAQMDFLARGPARLRPLRMEEIARQLKMHVSTVSRAVRDKFIDTPYGMLPLGYFFSGGIDSAEGTPIAARAVKQRIRGLIERENRSRPLSDRQIVETLSREGIALSRRTVAKYRLQENIAGAAMRRRAGPASAVRTEEWS